MTFELHDRDCRKVLKSHHIIFGEDSLDDIIGTYTFGTNLNDGTGDCSREDLCDRGKINASPYGVASFDLSRLLKGEHLLELTAPVFKSFRMSPSDHPLSKFQHYQIQPGDYIESECEMSVTFELMQALPLRGIHSGKSPQSGSGRLIRRMSKLPPLGMGPCLFNRLVYIIAPSQEGMLLIDRIVKGVNEINVKALALDYLPAEVLPAALSTYKLTMLVYLLIN